MNIPLTKPWIDEAEIRAAAAVLESGWLTQGKRVEQFERKICEYTGAASGVATSSCTTALHLSLIAAGIGPGDEVICPSYTFIATANAIKYCGAVPRFADIDPRTFNIDPKSVENAVNEKTRAVLAVHQIGLSADVDGLKKVTEKHGLKLLEDAAPTLGAEYRGKKVGCDSELISFSFHPRKCITTGEGGIVLTNNEEYVREMKILRSHGASISDVARHQAAGIVFEEYPVLGYNYRMSDIHAAVGIAQLDKLDKIIKKRRAFAEVYSKSFSDSGLIIPPNEPEGYFHTYQTYAVMVSPGMKSMRDEIIKKLAEKGISSRRGIPPIHLEPYYSRQFPHLNLPVTEDVSLRTIFLPLYYKMTDQELEYVIHNVNDIFRDLE